MKLTRLTQLAVPRITNKKLLKLLMQFEDTQAFYVRLNWISTNANLCAMATTLASFRAEQVTKQRKSKRDFASAFNVILAEMEVNNAYETGWRVYVPLNNNLYSGKTRRNPTYTSEIKDAFLWLIKEGYLRKVEGIKTARGSKADKTRFLPFAYVLTNKWRKEIAAKPMSGWKEIRRNPLSAYVQVRKDVGRGKTKRKVAIQLTPDLAGYDKVLIEETNDLLRRYDELISNTVVTIGKTPYQSGLTSMTRIFSQGSFSKGGRYYSQIQNLRSETRPYIYLNDEPTIEIDYSSFHPALLYSTINKTIPDGDAYVIEGFSRDEVKTAFNVMLNRTGKVSSAYESVMEYVCDDEERAKRLVTAILFKHHEIRDSFNTGAGLELQRKDSDIVTKLLTYFVDNNIPIVTVHDSAIVPVRHVQSLKMLMAEVYFEVVETGYFATSLRADGLTFSKALTDAIDLSMADGHVSPKQWNALLDSEPVQVTNSYLVSIGDE
jgi:hypothetical protein